jgi:hypothetical protein
MRVDQTGRVRRNQSRAMHIRAHGTAIGTMPSTRVKAQRTRQMQGEQKTTSDREATDPGPKTRHLRSPLRNGWRGSCHRLIACSAIC